jgi:hypothetical protein
MVSGVLFNWLAQSSVLAIASSVAVATAPLQVSAIEKTSDAPLELRGAQEGEYFGVSVAAVGDVDGDGVRDLLVGANNYTTNDPFIGLAGRRREDRTPYVVLYSGRDRRELLRIPADAGAKQSNFGLCVVGAADVDDDGRPDLAFGLPQSDLSALMRTQAAGNVPGTSIEVRSSRDGRRLWSGSGQAGQLSGFSCALLDDADGDGCRDLAAGGQAFAKVRSEVSLYSGKTGRRIGALQVPENACEYDQDFGIAIACIGDLDDDGVRDVAVGYPGMCRESQRSLGAVYAYSGKSGALSRTWAGQRAWQHFGCAVAGLKDLDGDGVEEIAVGARGEQERGPFSGAAYVLSPRREQPLYRFEGQRDSEFGSALGSAGDYNGDGVDDLWVGAVRDVEDTEKRGATVIYSGKDGAELARSIGGVAAALGDVNGDGCDDLAVGCHTEAQGRGVVRILLGHR